MIIKPQNKNKIKAEYVWLDGNTSMPQTRSKTRMIPSDISPPEWAFDGGSTNQGSLKNSDCYLKPVRSYTHPFYKEEGSLLVYCEVYKDEKTPHEANMRAVLRKNISDPKRGWLEELPIFGFEQEFTLMGGEGKAACFMMGPGLPPQGDYYCGNGASRVMFRKLSEEHMDACLKAGLPIAGTNAEVMPGQWEYQTEPSDPLQACDDLWVSRFILDRISETFGIGVSFDPKPAEGDWNGAGCHTNFSTAEMRESYKAITSAIKALKSNHDTFLEVCGDGLERRLTGECETSDMSKFTSGVGDRGASIRIPRHVKDGGGGGYLEDRRPCANIDPYKVSNAILETVIKSPALATPC